MPQPLFIADAENAAIKELKQVSRLGSIETATRCTAIQMLLAGINRELVCNALLVTTCALRKWINRFIQSRTGGHLRLNVIGMVCPRSGEFFAIEASHSDSATYQAFLDEADKSILLFVKMKKNY